MSPLLTLVLAPKNPLDRLVGDWNSIETVGVAEGKKTIKLKGKNRWVFKDDLLEIDETYTVAGDPKPGQNHILMQIRAGGKLNAWWYLPQADAPLFFEGNANDEGLTLTRLDGLMQISYRWDGNKAFDAKLLTRPHLKALWAINTVARYTKK